MTNKELKEKLANMPKDKYIYQRYDGKITKYKVSGEYYINVEGGIAINKNKQLLLGKVSENIIDLVEVGDIVEIIDVLNVDIHYIWNEAMLNAVKGDIKNGLALGRILTKEQFKANCYKVGGEDE